ncbi:MAG: hypothetical protein ACR2PR_07490 [Pseudohongiellaceae bacterium]
MNTKEIVKNWTLGPDGKPVIWNLPPYRQGALLSLLLPGEDPHALEDSAVHQKRIQEYYLLCWRDSRKIADVSVEQQSLL